VLWIQPLPSSLPARCFSTSSRIYNLPARNIRVLGDLCRICFSESSSFARYSAMHSSSASMHMKVGREDAISCKISTISPSPSLRPPMTFFWARKAWTILTGISASPPATCFKDTRWGLLFLGCKVEVEACNCSISFPSPITQSIYYSEASITTS